MGKEMKSGDDDRYGEPGRVKLSEVKVRSDVGIVGGPEGQLEESEAVIQEWNIGVKTSKMKWFSVVVMQKVRARGWAVQYGKEVKVTGAENVKDPETGMLDII